MNPEIKQRWIEALKSGQYWQGKNLLKQEDSEGQITYCCLGVLCELYLEDYPEAFGGWVRTEKGEFSLDSQGAALPGAVREWSGMESSLGGYGGGGALFLDNDTYNKSFGEIAEIIEEKF